MQRREPALVLVVLVTAAVCGSVMQSSSSLSEKSELSKLVHDAQVTAATKGAEADAAGSLTRALKAEVTSLVR